MGTLNLQGTYNFKGYYYISFNLFCIYDIVYIDF